MPHHPAGIMSSGLIDHLLKLSRRPGRLAEPVHAWLAGGFAVHFYTAHRVSGSIDIELSHKT